MTAPDLRATLAGMTRHTYRFGDYRIDPTARELQRAGELVVLSPKVFDSLVYLIEHRDRAVGRDELIAAVWGKVDVTDTLLGQTVLKARRAIGDTGGEQNAIRTIPRFGYRWIGELEVDVPAEPLPIEEPVADAAPPPAEPVADAASASPPPPRHRRRRRLVLLAALVLAAIAAAGLVTRRMTSRDGPRATPAAAPDAQTIAVLPVSVSAGEEWGWLRLGMMDLIGSRLRRGGLAIVPSDNVVAATHAQADANDRRDGETAAALKERTGAQRALTAALARVGQQWQLRLELRGRDGVLAELQTQDADPVEATRAACDRLLAMLGKPPLPREASEGKLPLDELVQRIEAAVLSEDFATAGRLIESAPPAERETPEVQLRLAQVEFHTGAAEAARGKLETLLGAVSAESSPVLRARILASLGGIAIRDARAVDAAAAFEEAIRLTETRHEPGLLGKAYSGLGMALRGEQRYDEAAAAFARARVALSLAGDALGLAVVDDNEGLLDNVLGRPASALAALQRAADTAHRFGLVNDLVLIVAAQIDTHLLLLDPANALHAADEFLPLRARITNPRSRNSFDLRHAAALAATGRIAQSRALLDELERSPVLASQAGLVAAASLQRAQLDLAEGNPEAAVTHARSARESLASLEQGDARADAWMTLIRALRAAGQHASARDEVEHFARWAQAAPDLPRAKLLSTLAKAEQAWTERRRDDADRLYESALEQAERRTVPQDLADVVTSWGNALIEADELDRASVVAGRAARWSSQDFDCALLQARLYRALGETDAWQAALDRARTLAGERPLPAAVSAPAAPSSRGME